MKKYDRESKKYLLEEEFERKSKRRELCKGGKPHDWELCLPPYGVVSLDGENQYGFDVAEQFYTLLEKHTKALREAEDRYERELASLGLKSSYGMMLAGVPNIRHYVCLNCKRKTNNPKQ